MFIPKSLLWLWEKSDEPWGAKNIKSHYIYVNAATRKLFNLSDDFNIKGKSDNDIPSLKKFTENFKQQDQKVKESRKRISSIETHYIGKKNTPQLYKFDRYPLFDTRDELVGMMFHGQKLQFYTGLQYVNQEPAYSMLPDKPNDFFTNEELDMVFFMLLFEEDQKIAKELKLLEKDVDTYRQRLYEKTKTESLEDFKAFCHQQGFNRYVPQKFLHFY